MSKLLGFAVFAAFALGAYALVAYGFGDDVREPLERGGAAAHDGGPEIPRDVTLVPGSTPDGEEPEEPYFGDGVDPGPILEMVEDSHRPRFEGTLAGIRLTGDPAQYGEAGVECAGERDWSQDAYELVRGSIFEIFPNGYPSGVAQGADPGAATICDHEILAAGVSVIVDGVYYAVIQRILRPEPWSGSTQPPERTTEEVVNGQPVVFQRSYHDDHRGAGRIVTAVETERGWVVTLIIGSGIPFDRLVYLAEEVVR